MPASAPTALRAVGRTLHGDSDWHQGLARDLAAYEPRAVRVDANLVAAWEAGHELVPS